jgi:hypothetical protein
MECFHNQTGRLKRPCSLFIKKSRKTDKRDYTASHRRHKPPQPLHRAGAATRLFSAAQAPIKYAAALGILPPEMIYTHSKK